MKNEKSSYYWREVLFLSLAGALGTAAALPYMLTLAAPALKGHSLPLPLPILVSLQLLQSLLLITLVTSIGLACARGQQLGAPLLESWLADKRIGPVSATLKAAVPIGVLVSITLSILDAKIFDPRMPPALVELPRVPHWQQFLACFYGGITEELLIRLGVLSITVWLLRTVTRKREGERTSILWIATVVAAVIFGLGHLPVTKSLYPLTPWVVTRAMTLNGLGGLAFGYLYWRGGLECAMLAHFSADFTASLLK